MWRSFQVPVVVQFNKRDLPDVVPEAELLATWGPTGLPVFMASATQGQGILETFQAALEQMFEAVDRTLQVRERFQVERDEFVRAIVKQA